MPSIVAQPWRLSGDISIRNGRCRFRGLKRTWLKTAVMSASDPKADVRSSSAPKKTPYQGNISEAEVDMQVMGVVGLLTYELRKGII